MEKYSDRNLIRERMKEETGFLNSRTNIFLLSNSILFTGAQLSQNTPFWLIILGLSTGIIWYLSSYQNYSAIKNLSIKYHESDNSIDKLIQKDLFWKIFRPTILLGIWLPLIFISVWFIILLEKLYKVM